MSRVEVQQQILIEIEGNQQLVTELLDWGQATGHHPVFVPLVGRGQLVAYYSPEVAEKVITWLRSKGHAVAPSPTTPAIEKLIAAVRAECANFNFPDEDRPLLWEALQELDNA